MSPLSATIGLSAFTMPRGSSIVSVLRTGDSSVNDRTADGVSGPISYEGRLSSGQALRITDDKRPRVSQCAVAPLCECILLPRVPARAAGVSVQRKWYNLTAAASKTWHAHVDRDASEGWSMSWAVARAPTPPLRNAWNVCAARNGGIAAASSATILPRNEREPSSNPEHQATRQ
jgi:hypothetical protein